LPLDPSVLIVFAPREVALTANSYQRVAGSNPTRGTSFPRPNSAARLPSTTRFPDNDGMGIEAILERWGYLGVFVGILLTGIGFPMPEELPVVVGGGLAGHGTAIWWIMLPVCIVGVVIGDGLLYGIGRLWGPRLLQYNWVKTKLLPPDRLQKIEDNFHKHGIKILLFARMTPGIRAPIFFTAGLTRLSLVRFLIADGIYAIPGVTLLFFLGYWFTEGMINLIKH